MTLPPGPLTWIVRHWRCAYAQAREWTDADVGSTSTEPGGGRTQQVGDRAAARGIIVGAPSNLRSYDGEPAALTAASPSARHASTSAPPIPFCFHARSSCLGNAQASLASSALPSCASACILSGVSSTPATSSLALFFLARTPCWLLDSSGFGADSLSVSLIEDACE